MTPTPHNRKRYATADAPRLDSAGRRRLRVHVRRLRAGATLAGAALVVAACGSVDSGSGLGDASAAAVADPQPEVPPTAAADPPDVTVSGLTIAQTGVNDAAAPTPLVDLGEIVSGGPPPDGIPSIDEPRFVNPADVDWLSDREPVLAIDIDGDRRAYPVQVLMWHEIVNDTVGGVPVAVTYCPLCNSAVAVDRRVDDRVLEFGTSGMLWNSALVMYDRQTESLWSHFTGQSIVGELTGTELEQYPVATVAWGAWREANPDGLVLSRDTGFDRQYGRNPYVGYDDVDNDPFLFRGDVDGRYTAMTRIVGFEFGETAVAVPLAALRAAPVQDVDVDGERFVVWWEPGTSSALDAERIANGIDVGATGVFVGAVDGERLTFTPGDDGGFVDAETGSRWNLLGTATAGPLAGAQLTAVPHVDTFWFAWSTFRPDTLVID